LSKEKVLIVYEVVGQGHEKVAGILEDLLSENGYSVVKTAMSDLIAAKSFRGFAKIWNFLVRHNLIFLANALMLFSTRLFIIPFFEVWSTERICRKIGEVRPDILISTIHCYNKAMSDYAEKCKTPFFVFVTEVFPTFLDTVAKNAVHFCYFEESAAIVRAFDFEMGYYTNKITEGRFFLNLAKYSKNRLADYWRKGIKAALYCSYEENLPQRNDAVCYVLGPFSDSKFSEQKDRAVIAHKLAIADNHKTVLVVSGSIGGHFVFDVVRAISMAAEPFSIIAACGQDARTLSLVRHYVDTYSGASSISSFGFVDFFDELLSVADVVVCRPSAQVVIECLIKMVPIVTTRESTFNDYGGLKIIEKYELGEVCGNENEIVARARLVLEQKDFYKSNIEQFLKRYPGDYRSKENLILEAIAKA
jgi:hypothetical protein